MERVTLKEMCRFEPVAAVKASDGVAAGKYPLYTSSPVVSKRTDKALFFEPSLVFGMGGVASLHYADEPFSATNTCRVMVLRKEARQRVVLKYIYYYLRSHFEILEQGFSGNMLQHIAKGYIEDIVIPLRIVEDQERIVEVLDMVSGAVAKRRRILDLFGEFRKNLFLEMFGDPVLNTRGFPVKPLRDVLHTVEMGISPRCEKETRTSEEQYGVLRQDAVTKGYFDPSLNKWLSDESKVKKQFLVAEGDVLISRKNTPGLIGTAVYVFEEPRRLLFHDTMYRLVFDPSVLSGIYLCYVFNDANFHRYLSRYSTGTLVSMSNLSLDNLYKLKIPVPPVALQHDFAERVKRIHTHLKVLEKHREALEELLPSTAKRLFSEEFVIRPVFDLYAFLRHVDVLSKEIDLSPFRERIVLKELVEWVRNPPENEGKDMYDRAKQVVFGLLREGRLVQEFDKELKKVRLALV